MAGQLQFDFPNLNFGMLALLVITSALPVRSAFTFVVAG
jgi:hypothetical protein